ncbi:MAG: hypothetical protein A3K09_00930 [Nitrospinae bacterium RIFCSPLOWO2_12_FULL_47_7]|nr:MAG: hypothetical protein A3K09_00930 [Nitrospinae bacterium RIFCSPLOWO2_12_FULL_47_7]
MEIKYSERAVKQIRKIYKGDRKSAEMMLGAMESYAGNPSPGKFDIKVLKGKYGNFKRLRSGDYRIIFDDDENVIFVYEVKHRQGHIMIKTQIIKEDRKPVAVILDYKEYLRLKEIEEDRGDYFSALDVKKKNKKWTSHRDLKKTLGL